MTNLQEARLAREAEMCYATLAMVTDYDCWHEEEADVTGTAVMEVIAANVRLSQRILKALVASLPEKAGCACGSVLDTSVITSLKKVPAKTLDSLEPILRSYRKRRNL